ncbi:MAG: AAA family ATPase, partial [Desulfuromonadaceae bacterium]|nr:AAA family ATPase [Desulfuromonadaceae bacterium]
MNSMPDGVGTRACWFVGASYGGTEDQTTRFYKDGIWECNSTKHLEDIKSMRVGDHIAIKATYTRKRNLPFDNRGKTVSVMSIKAIGTITENLGDGQRVIVDWTPFEKPREWYFYTYRAIVWRVLPGDWTNDALIAFAFDDKPQDLYRFRNAPYWKERFGDRLVDKSRFQWSNFYEAVADKLRAFKENREPLVEAIHNISSRVDGLSYLQDHFTDGTSGPLKDICPFTTLGTFNRGITDSNRKIIATELAKFLDVEEPVPETFEGIPVLNNQKSWFFSFQEDRQPDNIDILWEIFNQAIEFSDTDNPETRASFIAAFDDATHRRGVGWNLSMGLYWIRPWAFPTLDSQSRTYIDKKLRIQIGNNGPSRRCNAADYLKLLDTLDTRFQEDAYPVHSFPELSLAAWRYEDTPASSASTSSERKGWQAALIQCIIKHCKKTGKNNFTFQEMLQYLPEFAQMFPDNNTLESTIARQLQILRDKGLVEFIDNKGNYEWIGSETIDSS